MSNPKLSDEELRALEVLRQASAERARIRKTQGSPVQNADKFSVPIGIDDEGRAFPVHGAATTEADPLDALARQSTEALQFLEPISRRTTPLKAQYEQALGVLRAILDLCGRGVKPTSEDKARLRLEIRSDRELPLEERECVRRLVEIDRLFQNLQ